MPERQLGLDPLLEGDEAQLLEAGDLCLGEGLVREVGERRPRQSARASRRAPAAASGSPPRSPLSPLPQETLEPVNVELLWSELEDVAGVACGFAWARAPCADE